jgi:hypothetical protein
MAVLSLEDFKKTGGEPSGKFFSHYSKMCSLLEKVHDMREHLTNYVPKDYQDKFLELQLLVDRFHPNDTGTSQKKADEITAVRALKDSMKTELEYVKISQLLDKMANSGKALISNTGKAMREKIKNRRVGIGFSTDNNINAQYSGSSLVINVTNFWKTEKLAMGLVAHEYHHILSGRPADTYADEYVAHWKQYTVMELGQDRFNNLNHWLLDDPAGYRLRGKLAGRAPFAKPQDAGLIWTNYVDNKG